MTAQYHNPQPRFYTATEAARLTGFSYWYIRTLAAQGVAPVAALYGRRAPLFDTAGIAWLVERRARTARTARD